MANISAKTQFTQQLERQFDELVNWVIANSPNETLELSSNDFADLRREFLKTANEGNVFAREPEPEEGGAQYIPVTPAPWP